MIIHIAVLATEKQKIWGKNGKGPAWEAKMLGERLEGWLTMVLGHV